MNPLTFLAPYKLLIEIGAVVLILGMVALGIHKFLDYEQGIGYDRAVAEYKAQEAKDREAAKQKEIESAKQKETAENERTLQGQRIDALASALNTTANRLRGASSTLLSNLPSTTPEAARATAVAFSSVFGECVQRLTEVARIADGHAADVRLLKAAP